MRLSVRSVLLGAGALVLAIASAGVGAFLWLRHAPRHVPEGQPELAWLDDASLSSFKQTFNDGSGTVRILVLLSPT